MREHAPEQPIVRRLRREAALDSTFSRAVRIQRGKGVLSYDVAKGSFGDVVVLSGSVEGSKGERYRTHVELDLTEDDIVDYGCDCPAAARYRGMCKHELALALRYLSDAAGADGSEGTAEEVPLSAAEPSSAAVLGLLKSAENGRATAAALARAEARGDEGDLQPVSIDVAIERYYHPVFSTRYRWALRFRVRRGAVSYAVRNISALVGAWRSGSTFEYGRNLAFAHVPRAFDEVSRSVLDLVSSLHERVSEELASGSEPAFDPFVARLGGYALPVGEADVARLLDLLAGGTVRLVLSRGGRSEADGLSVDVVEGDPHPAVAIEARGDGSFDLSLRDAIVIFKGAPDVFVYACGRIWRCGEQFVIRALPVLEALAEATGPLHIAHADAASFSRLVLPVLEEFANVSVPSELAALAPRPEFRFSIGDSDADVTCSVVVAYGDVELALAPEAGEDAPAGIAFERDGVAEARALGAVERYFTHSLAFRDSDDERLYLLMTEGLKELAQLGTVLLSKRLRTLAVRPAPELTVRVTGKSGLLDVELGASGMKPADMVALLNSYRRNQRYVRLSNGDIMRLGERARAAAERATALAEGLDIELTDLAEGVTGLSPARAPFIEAMLEGSRSSGLRMRRDASFRDLLRRYDDLGRGSFDLPESLHATLRPYQVDGFDWLQSLERLGFGGILADDMGLGKTLQVIAHVTACRERHQEPPTLVVCPASLVYNWVSEFNRFVPGLDVRPVVGDASRRALVLGAAREADVLVTSYDLMRRDIESYASLSFARLVFDEAQHIKNARTQVARCARSLQAPVAFALTGTPVENRLAELWGIFQIVVPGLLGRRDRFVKRFESPVEGGDDEAARELCALVSPFILRRLKGDVLADLPEKTENVVYVGLEGEQERLYRASEDRLALQIAHELPEEYRQKHLQVLAELMRLRQLCCDPRLCYEGYTSESAKLDACLELVSNAVESGHAVLLFSQFTSMLELISAALRARGIPHLLLDGSTPKEDRARMVDAFQSGESRVFLISLRAGGFGLNLTAADVVIHYDPWWNTAVQDQATDRAHRIGQKRSVTVYRLIARNTIEERILALQETKRDLADAVVAGAGGASGILMREDILALLGARNS